LHQLSTPRRALPGLPHWLRWGLSALILLFLLGVLIWQQWAAPATPVLAPSATATNAAAASNHSTTASVNSDQAAVLAVVAAYNAAEAQVAQTLVLSPTLPLLEPQGLLAQRRAREIAWRQQTHAAHATRLLRWAIGAIEIDPIGTNATITTQESWQDQVGSNLPRTATVRVLYTLRRADAQSTWRIVDAESTPL
jgi:hypothetical protein